MDRAKIAERAALLEGLDELRTIAISGLEVREEGDSLALGGYAATFDTPYVIEDWLGSYTESVAAGAFAKTLAERADVRLLLNHGDLPLARTKSGTLELREDSVGLRVEAELDGADPDVRRLYPKMKRRDLDEMSFAFRTVRQEWNEDYTERKLLEVKLYDVSIVTFPANPATSATLRAPQLLAELSTIDADALAAAVRSAPRGVRREGLVAVHRALGRLLGEEAEEPRDTPATIDPLALRRREQEQLKIRSA